MLANSSKTADFGSGRSRPCRRLSDRRVAEREIAKGMQVALPSQPRLEAISPRSEVCSLDISRPYTERGRLVCFWNPPRTGLCRGEIFLSNLAT